VALYARVATDFRSRNLETVVVASNEMLNAIKLLPGALSLVLCAASIAGGKPSAANATCGPPRLTILSPAPGETVRPPPEIRFRIRCFRVGPAPYGHLHAWTGPPGASPRLELRPHRQSGMVVLPDPLLSGRRTLTFQLARANHSTVRNREARVVVRGVVFESP
jgi:hypothetical protein